MHTNWYETWLKKTLLPAQATGFLARTKISHLSMMEADEHFLASLGEGIASSPNWPQLCVELMNYCPSAEPVAHVLHFTFSKVLTDHPLANCKLTDAVSYSFQNSLIGNGSSLLSFTSEKYANGRQILLMNCFHPTSSWLHAEIEKSDCEAGNDIKLENLIEKNFLRDGSTLLPSSLAIVFDKA